MFLFMYVLLACESVHYRSVWLSSTWHTRSFDKSPPTHARYGFGHSTLDEPLVRLLHFATRIGTRTKYWNLGPCPG